MKLLGYFLLLGGLGIVSLSLGWIAGFHGLGTIMAFSVVPLLISVLLAFFVVSMQNNTKEVEAMQLTLNIRTAQLQEANRTIRSISTKDRLTGLYNKRGFREMVQREITRSIRLKSNLVILSIHFPGYSSVEADKRYSMMSILGKKLMKWMRETDLFARVSEDTLAFLLLDTQEEGARIFLERLIEQLNGCSFHFPVFSTGMTVFPVHGEKVDILLNRSVELAKNTQPGEVSVFSESGADDKSSVS